MLLWLQKGALLFLLLCLVGCSATRKLSRLERRDPSSLRAGGAISELRSKIIQTAGFSKTCPKEIREHFADLAQETIQFPTCPDGLAETIQNSFLYLKIEERTTLEEVLSSQCRSLGATEFSDSLENLVLNFDSTGPLGRRNKIEQTLQATDHETKALSNLKVALQELVDYHLPLDRWVRRNGEFVLPEEELSHLYRLVVEEECKLSSRDVDQSYRTIRSLEELARILKDGEQESRVETFLKGVHLVIEQKLKEFFYP